MGLPCAGSFNVGEGRPKIATVAVVLSHSLTGGGMRVVSQPITAMTPRGRPAVGGGITQGKGFLALFKVSLIIPCVTERTTKVPKAVTGVTVFVSPREA